MNHQRFRRRATGAVLAAAALAPFFSLSSASASAPVRAGSDLPTAPLNKSGVEVVPGEVLVKFKAGAASPQAIGAARRTSDLALSGENRLLHFTSPKGVGEATRDETLSLVASMKARADVEYAQPNYVYQSLTDTPPAPISPVPTFTTIPTPVSTIPLPILCLGPNDPLYPNQWHYPKISLPCAWTLKSKGVGSPVVAVLDTGKTLHPDLASHFVGGYDFISNVWTANDGTGRDADPTDPGDAAVCGGVSYPNSWHGTHVAGTIGASTNNAVGVAGVNWNAKILPVRVLGRCGGTTTDIADAIRWAAGLPVAGAPFNAFPAKVINMSLGGYLGAGTCAVNDPVMQSAINDVTILKGVNVVVAAGNDSADAKNYTPASCNNTITVGATNVLNQRAWYSNFGSYVDVAAPGGETTIGGVPVDKDGNGKSDGVLSTLLNSTGTAYTYGYYQGTSMASPHVAGVVSLMLAKSPALTPAQVLNTLKLNATPLPGLGLGSGLINAYKSIA
jgi:serine protease